MHSQRQRNQVVAAASLVIYVIALILLAIVPQPDNDDERAVPLQVVMTEFPRQARGVPIVCEMPPQITPALLEPAVQESSGGPDAEPVAAELVMPPQALLRTTVDPTAPLTDVQQK